MDAADGSHTDEERVFLHDVANLASVASGQIRLIKRKAEKYTESSSRFDADEVHGFAVRLEKIFTEVNLLVRNRRNHILGMDDEG